MLRVARRDRQLVAVRSAVRRIFYSWQSELPSKSNRGFIQDALDLAVKALGASEQLLEAVVDRDTLDVPGAPNIVATIFEKIANADAFVADVSITDGSTKRPAPNANVLIELGYALHALGESRIVLVANRHFGTVDLLPFDLRQLRCLVYDCDPDATDKAAVRRPFAETLNTAMRAVLAQPSDYRLPDIRVTATRGQLIPGIDEDATPVVTMTVENHSSVPLYLSGVSLQLPPEDSMPRGVWFKSDVYGRANSGGRVEPGDRYDFYFDEREFPLAMDGDVPLCVEATDKIKRVFLSNRAEFAKLLSDIAKARSSMPPKPHRRRP